MKYEVLLNRILRIPIKKASKLFEDYGNNDGFKTFAEVQRVSDVMTYKTNAANQIKKEFYKMLLTTLYFMAEEMSNISKDAFESVKHYPMVMWIECIGLMKSDEIMALLNNFHKELSSPLIETCIINLPEDMQLTAIDKYKSKIDIENSMYSNFYYSVSDKARLKLRKCFPNIIGDDVLLELEDLDEDVVIDKLSSEKERLMKLSSDDLIEFILLKATKAATLNRFFDLYREKVNECSIPKFKLLFTRYRYIRNGNVISHYGGGCNCLWGDEDVKKLDLLTDNDLFKLFSTKFHEFGINETLILFDQKYGSYSVNEFTELVVLEFLDIAYDDIKDSNYINDLTIQKIIKSFEEKCRSKDYSLEDLEGLVRNIGKDGKVKLIMDDYIEAIIACGKLLKNRVINDKAPIFLELRDKFRKFVISRCEKDGTYTENISLNGVFYRLAKGTIPFEDVYMTKTYRGLIYLSKCGQLFENADYITKFLTDEQLVKLNITPVIRFRNTLNRTNTNADNLSFKERMGLQLLCYFGKDKAKYLLESNMQGNRMENLFDGLKYADVTINDDGTSNVNEELLGFLFGKGMMKENNSIMNKMIREEIPGFEKYFTDFCNSFEEIKAACNGILSVKRIVKHYNDVDLPVELKPDELPFKFALNEMYTLDMELLTEAIGLCKDARNRVYSTIPKVEGHLGDFNYEVLDLGNPLAVAVGNLSHCCFVVRGVSYSALQHSMRSKYGRTFVVYYKGQFLAQSWIWRNGDVICFDSVEAGCTRHGMYKDNIKLVDVYKSVAQEMLYISGKAEDDIQKVKVVTVGKSDYTFDNLKEVEGDVPRPLEKDLHVYDSCVQHVLAGEMPAIPRYGVVGAQYKDPRKKAIIINDVGNADIDLLDEVALNINSLRYQIHGNETPIEYKNYTKIISGDGWYILINNDSVVDSGALNIDEEITSEYDKYLSRFKGNIVDVVSPFVKSLKPLTSNNR